MALISSGYRTLQRAQFSGQDIPWNKEFMLHWLFIKVNGAPFSVLKQRTQIFFKSII